MAATFFPRPPVIAARRVRSASLLLHRLLHGRRGLDVLDLDRLDDDPPAATSSEIALELGLDHLAEESASSRSISPTMLRSESESGSRSRSGSRSTP